MTFCSHPDADVVIHHRDAVRLGTMEALQIPAYCERCETELVLLYRLDEIENARRDE